MTTSPRILWTQCLEIIRSNVNEQQYQTWFTPIKFKSYDIEAKELTISTPSQFFYEYLEEHFRKIIHLTIYRVFGENVRLVYLVEVVKKSSVKIESDDVPSVAKTETSKRQANQSPTLTQAVGPAQDLDSQLNPNQTFSNFIEGISNKLPRSIGQAIAEKPSQQTFNPLFIYGPSGVGKTHLVNAIGTRLKELHPGKRVLYLSAHLFQVQFTDSIRHNTFNDFMHFYQSIDVLIIDDIQEMMGLERTQYAFFHIFNHLRQNGRQIILTSDRPPISMQGMEDRLLTRFKSGLLAELEKPEVQLRKDILRSKIKHDGLQIPENVIDYISQNVSNSVRELEGVIHSLLAYSVVYNKDVDLDFAQSIIQHAPKTVAKEVSLDKIVEEVSIKYNVKQEDIYGKSRKAEIVLARQLSIYLAQMHTQLSTSKIGLLIGNKNHATVLHSIKTIKNRLKADNALKEQIDELTNILKGTR
ncbi:MAG: chromosomal replication initiator protein DnaA [Bacteroidaceae bacterium]|nr:chromosomal replication initiator protein DnaA [Bacteroidaceae bacterium]